MHGGIGTSFDILARTANDAADRVLIAALDSEWSTIRDGAFHTILRRRSHDGHREIIRRLHALPPTWQKEVFDDHDRLAPALRDAIQSDDEHLCGNACLASAWLHEYELIPSLLRALERPNAPDPGVVGRTLLYLAGALCEELAERPAETAWTRDPELVRRQVVASLELSVARFATHRRREVLETYVRLARCGDKPLADLLHRPLDPAFAPVVEMLTQSEHAEVIRLVLGFLAQAQPPAAIAKVVSRRSDAPFLQAFLQEAAVELAGAWARSVKRLDLSLWSRAAMRSLMALDEACQQTAVAVLMASSTPRDLVFDFLAHLLQAGRAGARRAAAVALDEFRGARANDLVQTILADVDPGVVAAAVPQLRRRGIPGALVRLIGMLESRHEAVRKAARESLSEFTFQQYVSHFDLLDDATRYSNGMLVKKVDPQTLPRLCEEMKSPLRSRRIRAVAVARSLELARETEHDLVELLQDEDHLVRTEAAALLAACQGASSAAALRRALADHSLAVREAARKSLVERGETDLEYSAEGYEGRTP